MSHSILKEIEKFIILFEEKKKVLENNMEESLMTADDLIIMMRKELDLPLDYYIGKCKYYTELDVVAQRFGITIEKVNEVWSKLD
jgi:hypothetical protein